MKLGRMRASYPDTFPISLSRNSEGGIGVAAFLAAASLEAAKLHRERGRERKGGRKRKRGGEIIKINIK